MIRQSKNGDFLSVSLDVKQTNVDDSKVACFLQLIMADITSLEITSPNLRFLKTVSENLQIETLSLVRQPEHSSYQLNYNGGSIHFSSVKSLSVINDENIVDIFPEYLVFDNLRSINMDLGRQNTDNWLEFLRNQNEGINNFELNIDGLTKEHLIAIPRKFPALKTVKIIDNTSTKNPHTQFVATDIVNFVEQNQSLEKLRAYVKMSTIDEWEKLQGKLGKWHTVVYNSPRDPLSKAIEVSKSN